MQNAQETLLTISRCWGQILERLPAGNADEAIVPFTISAMPEGLLPVWLEAAADRWGRVSGRAIPLQIDVDDAALLGVKVLALPDMRASVLLACMTHAAHEAISPEGVMVLDPLIARFLSKYPAARLPAAAVAVQQPVSGSSFKR